MEYTPTMEIIDFIKEHERFIVCGHREPDGDCLGSQLAVSELLNKLGKKTLLVSPGPFFRPEINRLEPLFTTNIPAAFSPEHSAAIITDCSTIERLGPLAEEVGKYRAGVIDHHSSGDPFGSAVWVDSASPSTTVLIYRLYQTFGIEPSLEAAEYLMFGIATDTGFFRHLGAGTGEVFRITAALVDLGVSPNTLHTEIFGSRTFPSRQLLGKLLNRTEEYYSGKLLITYQTLEDLEIYGQLNKDSDMLYMLLQGTKGTEVVALIREESAHECSVGLRSNRDIDVGKIAQNNGGGGHKRAAGFTVQNNRELVRDSLIDQFTILL